MIRPSAIDSSIGIILRGTSVVEGQALPVKLSKRLLLLSQLDSSWRMS
jgi:hypothetical protein